jgi:hypothetical protein
MAKRYVGQCSKCGDDSHPKGNVFRIMAGFLFDIKFPHAPPAPTEHVKVCNNCDTAHPFHTRISAKAKAREIKLQETLAWLDAQESE